MIWFLVNVRAGSRMSKVRIRNSVGVRETSFPSTLAACCFRLIVILPCETSSGPPSGASRAVRRSTALTLAASSSG